MPQWPLRESIVIISIWLGALCLAVLQAAAVSSNSKMNHTLCSGDMAWLGTGERGGKAELRLKASGDELVQK